MPEGTLRITDATLKDKHIADDADLDWNKFAQRTFAVHAVLPTDLRVHDALHTNLPGTAASDDLQITTGATWGTNPSYISAGDVKATTGNRKAAFFVQLPPNYEEAESVSICAWAGMTTTVADGSCTLDFEVFRVDHEAGATGADICTTAAQSINSTTEAEKTFTITATDLDPGTLLLVRMSIAYVDAATATAVIPSVWNIRLKCDTRG